MAYSEDLAQRIREALGEAPELVEKKMFGGLGFIFRGNMACGVLGEALLVRTGPQRYEEALRHPHTRPFDMTGRPMSGWILVDPQGYADEGDLREWIRWGIDTTGQLPPK
jgi:hypothetical protein